MSYPLHESQVELMQKASSKKRELYLYEKIKEHGLIWSLCSDDGWVNMLFDEQQCLPVWPHPQFAQSLIKGNWADTVPTEITLSDFVNKWLPGMIEDETAVALFIGQEGTASVVSAQEMLDQLIEFQSVV